MMDSIMNAAASDGDRHHDHLPTSILHPHSILFAIFLITVPGYREDYTTINFVEYNCCRKILLNLYKNYPPSA